LCCATRVVKSGGGLAGTAWCCGWVVVRCWQASLAEEVVVRLLYVWTSMGRSDGSVLQSCILTINSADASQRVSEALARVTEVSELHGLCCCDVIKKVFSRMQVAATSSSSSVEPCHRANALYCLTGRSCGTTNQMSSGPSAIVLSTTGLISSPYLCFVNSS